MRTELLAYLTNATKNDTIKAVSELPWSTAQEPLYLKNMKKFYLDEEQIEQVVLIPTLPGYTDITQDTISVTGYFAVDAKNQPSGLSDSLNKILNAKTELGTGATSSYTTEIQDDVLIYTVVFQNNTTA